MFIFSVWVLWSDRFILNVLMVSVVMKEIVSSWGSVVYFLGKLVFFC